LTATSCRFTWYQEGLIAMSCAPQPDTKLCLATTFYVWGAMLGDSNFIVKELARARDLAKLPCREASYLTRTARQILAAAFTHAINKAEKSGWQRRVPARRLEMG
jgi:hypothetical protein